MPKVHNQCSDKYDVKQFSAPQKMLNRDVFLEMTSSTSQCSLSHFDCPALMPELPVCTKAASQSMFVRCRHLGVLITCSICGDSHPILIDGVFRQWAVL
jgi:hypothetical protein